MEFLLCKKCNNSYDEEAHQPRQAPCGHELCRKCIKSIIKNGIYECHKCKQKNEVITADDLPVSYGLIDVIRAFKAKTISLPRETEPNTCEATNNELCKVHYKCISHRCLVCKTWICEECLNDHCLLTECTTINSVLAMERMIRGYTQNIEKILAAFDADTTSLSSKIQEHSEKRKELLERAEKHEEEMKKIQIKLEHGKIQRENLVISRNNLGTAKSPYALMDRIEVIVQRKQALHSWTVKNIGADTDLKKALVGERDDTIKYIYIDSANQVEENNNDLSNDLPIVFIDHSISDISATASNASYFFYEIHTLLISNLKSDIYLENKDFLFRDKVLPSLLQNKKQYIRKMAETKKIVPYEAFGICDFGIYLIGNGIPNDHLVNIYICDVILQVCLKDEEKGPLVKKLICEVREFFRSKKEVYARSNIMEEYMNWLNTYKSFLKCTRALVYSK